MGVNRREAEFHAQTPEQEEPSWIHWWNMIISVNKLRVATDLRCETDCKDEPNLSLIKLTIRFCTLSTVAPYLQWHAKTPAQMWQQYSIRGRVVVLYKYKIASGGKYFRARYRQPVRMEALLAIHVPEIYFYQLQLEIANSMTQELTFSYNF